MKWFWIALRGMLILASWSTVVAQEFAGREKLRAPGEQEFRKDIVRVTESLAPVT